VAAVAGIPGSTATTAPTPQGGSYQTFDVVAHANSGLVPYEIDIDANGTPEWSGYVEGLVPEPGTCALTIAGLAVVGARLRRKKG